MVNGFRDPAAQHPQLRPGAPQIWIQWGGAAVRNRGIVSRTLIALALIMASGVGLLISAQPADAAAAAQLENALLRRSFALTEALLRQATTAEAHAFDPQVVNKHLTTTLDLAQAILVLKGTHHG